MGDVRHRTNMTIKRFLTVRRPTLLFAPSGQVPKGTSTRSCALYQMKQLRLDTGVIQARGRRCVCCGSRLEPFSRSATDRLAYQSPLIADYADSVVSPGAAFASAEFVKKAVVPTPCR